MMRPPASDPYPATLSASLTSNSLFPWQLRNVFVNGAFSLPKFPEVKASPWNRDTGREIALRASRRTARHGWLAGAVASDLSPVVKGTSERLRQ